MERTSQSVTAMADRSAARKPLGLATEAIVILVAVGVYGIRMCGTARSRLAGAGAATAIAEDALRLVNCHLD
ncbi:MAG TPA: hypothetical protein VHF01_14225 [Candidatus Acidoferrum sp.]|nr:hypothetical protein [Candidatus Acidoferrum sp.]